MKLRHMLNSLEFEGIRNETGRNRNTMEILGFWEKRHRTGFIPIEFDGFRKPAEHDRNAVEFLDIWESVHNLDFNSGEFARVKSQS